MTSKLKHKSVVFISDLRNIPLLAALSIFFRLKFSGCDVELWITKSKKSGSYDYGDHQLTKRARIVRYWQARIAGAIAIKNSTVANDYPLTGVISSLISITNDHRASKKKYPALYSDLLKVHYDACAIADRLISKKVSQLYVYNGRKASVYAAAITAKRNNVDLYFYEYGSCSRDYSLRDFSPHNWKKLSKELLAYYLKAKTPQKEKEAIANKEIKNKLNNLYTRTYSTNSHIKYDACIFPSSPHEYLSLDKDICDVSIPTVRQLLTEAYKVTKHSVDRKIAIRSHPNMLNDPSYGLWNDEILRLRDEGYEFDYYDSLSNISSYDLILKSEYIITDYSSIIIDAYYLGKDDSNTLIHSYNWYSDVYKYITSMELSQEEKKKELAFATSLRTKPATKNISMLLVRMLEVQSLIGF